MLGKFNKCPLPTSGAKRADEPLGLVHSDLCGKITPKSAEGVEYFLTLTDDRTRHVWVYALEQKSETFSKFCEWRASVEKSSGHKLKTLRTDNGGDFMPREFQNFLKAEGVRHEVAVPKTPQQNGVAERQNRTLADSARTMLIQVTSEILGRGTEQLKNGGSAEQPGFQYTEVRFGRLG